jgi:hypothetical protein
MALEVVDGGMRLRFSFDDLMRFHGPRSPGGVAHAYKVLERALPLLAGGAPPERRTIVIRTAFGGPGARDGFELVTRAVGEGRYLVDPSIARPALGVARERFVFVLASRQTVTLVLREGFVTDEFVALARADTRTPDEEAQLDALKREMADRVMAAPAAAVYDID